MNSWSSCSVNNVTGEDNNETEYITVLLMTCSYYLCLSIGFLLIGLWRGSAHSVPMRWVIMNSYLKTMLPGISAA